jgi:hypothetical protein
MSRDARTIARRYAPLLLLATVQLLLVVITPSRQADVATAGGPVGAVGTFDPTGTPVLGADGQPVPTVPGGAVVPGSGGGAALVTTPGGAVDGSGAPVTAGTAAAGEDLSRCDATGHQLGPIDGMPLCRPAWPAGADNGGATMTGVTDTEIRVVYYAVEGNAQVNAILATQNLAASEEDRCEALEAFFEEVNLRFELYGRHVVPLDGPGEHAGSTKQDCKFPYYQGSCTLTPPDVPCNRAEAREIAAMGPAYVIAPVANGAFYNELGKLGIIVSGGAHRPSAYLNDFPGFNYDLLIDGTRSARFIAEYWCKKLDGKPVQYAGASVMNSGTPGSGPPTRRLGIIYPATSGDPTFKDNVDVIIAALQGGMCGSPGSHIETYPYQSDINTATQQSITIAASIRAAGVTSVMCFCDPIAPAFLTAALDSQGWEPEHVLVGVGLLDYDLLGRLYTPTQWAHAFGLSQLGLSSAFDDSDASRVWRDVGRPGSPGDRTSNANWAYVSLMAVSFHYAGPNPTPASIRDGLFSAPPSGGWEGSGHDQRKVLVKFGEEPDDWTAVSDVREVWWDPNRISEVDGRAGSYSPVNGGQRYTLGQITPGDPTVFR